MKVLVYSNFHYALSSTLDLDVDVDDDYYDSDIGVVVDEDLD